MEGMTNSNQRPVNVDVEVDSEILKCKRRNNSKIGAAITPHEHYVGFMLEATTDYQLTKLAKEFIAEVRQELRNNISEN